MKNELLIYLNKNPEVWIVFTLLSITTIICITTIIVQLYGC